MAKRVRWGLVTAWRLAMCPTSTSPLSVKATTDGVVRLPSRLGMTRLSPPSITQAQLLVVPRSIPMSLSATGCSWGSGGGAGDYCTGSGGAPTPSGRWLSCMRLPEMREPCACQSHHTPMMQWWK